MPFFDYSPLCKSESKRISENGDNRLYFGPASQFGRLSSENRPAKRPQSGNVIQTHEHNGDFQTVVKRGKTKSCHAKHDG